MCVCVCVSFWKSMCLKFLLRNDFESLICWLDHWLCCMLDCIHVCVFHFSKNCFGKVARHLLDTYLDSFLNTSRYLHLSRFTKDLYIRSSRSGSHFFDLSRSVRTCSSPKYHLSCSKPLPLWFFKLFQDFLLLVSF